MRRHTAGCARRDHYGVVCLPEIDLRVWIAGTRNGP